MGRTEIKDYYKILEVLPAAREEEIKKSYRRLALLYHPDKNPANAFAEARFRELQEAYAVLSHPRKREQYDEERWLSGQFDTRRQRLVTAQSILEDSRRLRRHIDSIDVHRMNHQALQEVVFLLLSDAHMGLLEVQADPATRRAIAAELFQAVRALRYPLLVPIAERLLLLAGNDPLREQINTLLQAGERQQRWQRLRPWIIVITTLVLCLIVFLAGRR